MSNCGELIADALIRAIDDDYGRRALNRGEHIACITIDALAMALQSAYVYVVDTSMKSKATQGNWPSVEAMLEKEAFYKAATAGVRGLYTHFATKRTLGVLIEYDGNQLIWWMPRLVKEYTKVMKREAFKELNTIIKQLIKENDGNPNSWVTTGEAFSRVRKEIDEKALDSKKAFVMAREMSPQLQMSQRVTVSHGKANVGGARTSAIIQVLSKFANVDDYTHLGLPKSLLDIVKQIEGYFSLELNEKQRAEIRAKGVVDFEIADLGLNVSAAKGVKNKLDFKYLSKSLKAAIVDLEKRGMFKNAIECTGAGQALTDESTQRILEVIESRATGAKITKRPSRKKIQVEGRKLLKRKGTKACPSVKGGKKLATATRTNQPKVSEAERQAAIKAQRKQDSDLLRFIDQHLDKYIHPLMGKEGRLHWRSGVFAETASVDISRTKTRKIRVTHHYEERPYGVFDPVKGAPPWQTPERNPNELIRLAIRDIMRDKQISKMDYTLAQGKFTHKLGDDDE